jgi:hypothetical protein
LTGEALRHVALPGVWSRGTVGGSIAHGDPAAELPAVLLALGGEVVARGASGTRTIAADDLFVTYLTTALAPDEVLTHVRFPKADRTGFAEVARKVGDFALAGAAVSVTMNGDTVSSARVALFGVADRPIRATGAEQALAGRTPAEAAEEAGRIASEELEAKADSHARPTIAGRSSACCAPGAPAGWRGRLMTARVEGDRRLPHRQRRGAPHRGAAHAARFLRGELRLTDARRLRVGVWCPARCASTGRSSVRLAFCPGAGLERRDRRGHGER